MPLLSPSPETVTLGLSATTPAQETAFMRRFRREMTAPDAGRVLDLLAALSQHTNLSVACYCDDEARCHRSVLRALLAERRAQDSLMPFEPVDVEYFDSPAA